MTSEQKDVKVEDQLQLARIQIAQMKDEIAELTSRQDWTAREKELNERHARELYEQKMFFKGLMEEQKESHRVDMENLKKSLHEESGRNIQHIKMNLKNCLNIGSEDSAMDYAFMFSAIESCDINRLSPEAYLRKLILGLHEKKVEKKQLLPCYIGL